MSLKILCKLQHASRPPLPALLLAMCVRKIVCLLRSSTASGSAR